MYIYNIYNSQLDNQIIYYIIKKIIKEINF